MGRYAIIGFGCAGYHAAKAIRESGDRTPIDVYEATKEPPANPMLTTYYAGDKLSLEGAYPFGSMAQIMKELNLHVLDGVKVQSVKPYEKVVITADQKMVSYDKILIATGASAILPPMKGLPDPRVFVMRTMADAQSLKDYLAAKEVKRALVVGASMVGIKVAELFYKKGIDTTIADMAPFLFPLAAYESTGRELERRLQEKGFHFKWSAGIEEITRDGARFSDHTEVPADIICLCIGTRANLELAANLETVQGSGLEIRRGLVVNHRMETNIEGIYAAGDCCEGTNLQTGETMIIGLWANAGSQGQTAGQNMAGIPSEYQGNIVHNITHYMDTDFIGLGDTRLPGKRISWGDIRGDFYIEAVLDGKRLQSMNIIGGREVSGILKSWLMKRIQDDQAELSAMQKGVLLHYGLDQELIDRLGGIEE